MYTFICIHAYIYIYIYTYVHIYIYIYIYIIYIGEQREKWGENNNKFYFI